MIEIFSNHLIILKEQNGLYRPFNWHRGCLVKEKENT